MARTMARSELKTEAHRLALEFRTAQGIDRLKLFRRLGELASSLSTTYGDKEVLELAQQCGWTSPHNVYQAIQLCERIDASTFRRMVEARISMTDAKALIGIADEGKRRQAIDLALGRRLSGKALHAALAKRTGRTPGGTVRNFMDPRRTFVERIEEVRRLCARLSGLDASLQKLGDLPAKQRRRALRKLHALREELHGLRDELDVRIAQIDRVDG